VPPNRQRRQQWESWTSSSSWRRSWGESTCRKPSFSASAPAALTNSTPLRPQPDATAAVSKFTVSLSRLQAFMRTLVIMIVYFHRVVANKEASTSPVLPPELLMVIGISGAVYLTSKQMDLPAAPPKKATNASPEV
jgi:hypothetical protein